MKKYFKVSALVLAVAILFSSCIGSFSLTSRLKAWNESFNDKWANELIFVCLGFVQVYTISLLADALVINSIEFWTGSNPIAGNVGDTKIVKNSAGEDVQITTTENGYNLTNGEQEMQLVFDEAEKSWSALYNDQSVKLIKFIDENNAQLFTLNGNTMNVSLDATGVDAARAMLMQCNYAMNK